MQVCSPEPTLNAEHVCQAGEGNPMVIASIKDNVPTILSIAQLQQLGRLRYED